MSNARPLSVEFDRRHYPQAALYTAIIAGALLIIVWFVKFYQPLPVTAAVAETIEINLGSSDVGSGSDQPQIPGEPAPAQEPSYTPPQTSNNAPDEAVRDIEENNEPDAPPVLKPSTTKADAKKINEESRPVKTNTAATSPTPAPPAPQPKAVMGQVRGGNGSGGNGAAIYRPGTGEGQGGGPGDQGSVGGNPNGRDYRPRQLGAKVVSMPSRTFEDDFSESGKIVLDITVDENGRLVSATYQPRGSTISNRSQIAIAQRRAREISYPKYPGGFKQPHVFVFDVRN